MIQGREFLDVADSLLESHTEAHWRSAVSRAYYAAFHVARRFLSQHGLTVSMTANAHREVRDMLKLSGIPFVRKLGMKLDGLRTRRNEADYAVDEKLTPETSRKAVARARRIMSGIDSILPSDAQTIKQNLAKTRRWF